MGKKITSRRYIRFLLLGCLNLVLLSCSGPEQPPAEEPVAPAAKVTQQAPTIPQQAPPPPPPDAANTLDDPVLGDPVLGDPVLGDPVLGDPVLGDPVLGDPVLADHVLLSSSDVHWVGDFDEMVARRAIRVLVVYGRTRGESIPGRRGPA